MIIAAIVALAVLIIVAILQISLVFGAPLGHFAWGGTHKVLPAKLKIGSAVSIVIYAIMASFIASKSGLWPIISNETVLQTGLWIFAIYLTFGVFLNAISRSKQERNLMTPLALILAICFWVVALGSVP